MKPRKPSILTNGPSSFIASLMVASPAFAATVIWDGGPAGTGTDLGAVNWAGDVLPNVATPDTAQWNGSPAGALSLSYTDAALAGAAGNGGVNLELTAAQTGAVSLDSGVNTSVLRLNNITIAAGAGAFSLGNGTDTFNLTLGGAASTQTFTNNSSNAASIGSDAVAALGGGGNHLINFTGTGNWAVASNLAFAAGGQASLYKTGAGTLTLTGGGAFKEGATVNGAAIFSAVLKEGVTIINGGTYTHNITTNNGELVVGGLDTVGTNTRLEMNNASAFTGVDWLSIGRGNGTGATSSDLTLNNSASITATNMSGGFNGGGATTAPKGTITLNGSSAITVSNTINLAESPNSNISLVINSGTTFSQTANANQTRVAMGDNAQGTIHVNGGTASFHRDLTIGYAGTAAVGKLIIDSGTLNSATTVERWLKVGETAGSSGQVTVNGGTLNLNTNTDLRFTTSAAAAGTNVVTLNGGAIIGLTGNNNGVASGASVVDLNQASTNAAVNNTFNLNGGTLTIGQVLTANDSGTAAFKFNGGTLKAAAASGAFFTLGGANQTASVMAGGAIIDSNTFDITIAQPLLSGIAGDGGLTKLGTGKLTLSGTPGYTGATTVSAGTLALSGVDFTTGSGIAVNSGAKLVLANAATTAVPITINDGSLDVHGTVNALTVANNAANTVSTGNGTNNPMFANSVHFPGAATLHVQATGAVMDRYIETALLVTGGAGQVTVNAVNTLGAWTSGTDYPVVRHSGNFNGSLSHFTLAPVAGLNPNQTAQLVNADGAIAIRITGESLVWTGAQNSNWSTTAIGGSKNWTYLGTGIEFSNSSPVQFDDTASNFTVTLAQNVSPSAVVFNNDFNDYVLSSSGSFGITGGSLVKNGGGRLTITADNSYTGTTIIGGGIVEVSGAGSIADSSSITVAESAELVLNPATVDTYSHPINGAGVLTKSGTGALTLSGANGISGHIYMEGGTLNLNSAGALGTGPGVFFIEANSTLDNTSGAAITMTGNRPQNWNADVSFTGSNALNMGTGAVTLGGADTLCTVHVPASVFSVGGIGGAAFEFVKSGAGTLNIGGGNLATMSIQGGILGTSEDLTVANATGSGTLQNSGLVGTKWTFWNIAADQSFAGLIRNNDGSNTMQLGIVKRGTGKLTLANNSNNATSMLQVENGTLVLEANGTYGSRNDDNTPRIGTALVNTGVTNAVLEINGATVNYNIMANADAQAFRSSLSIGNTAGGAGAVKLNSGSLSMHRQLALGNATAFGGLTQNGGTMSVGGFVAMGFTNSPSVLNLKGGSFTHTGPLTAGAQAGGIGVVNISGSAAYNCTNTSAFGFWFGEGGTGVLNLSGNGALTLDPAGSGIELGHLASGNGITNLLGGNLTTKILAKGPGTGTLNFNGGKLTANAASATFVSGLTGAYVYGAGGTVDNAGNAITIAQPLLAPTGGGVTASGLTIGGGGLIETPLVTITGDGSGATAVAVIDASGNLTGITITNPGTGYTTATVALSGGGMGNTATVGGAPVIVPNVSGSMTFTGSATTILSGSNTYTGNTVVSSGSTLAVATSGGLVFKPAANGVSNKVTGAGTASFDGSFTIDTSGAALVNGNSWTLVDVASKTYNVATFALPGFTEASNVWTKVEGNNTWSFSEGTGVLSLSVSTGGGYGAWIGGFGLAAGDQERTDDPDHDGLDNLLEYALGGDPSSANTGITPTGSKSGSNFVFSFSRSDLAAANGDATLELQYGNNVSGWTTVAIPAASGTVGGVGFVVTNGSPTDAVIATIPTAGAVKFFARLKVTAP